MLNCEKDKLDMNIEDDFSALLTINVEPGKLAKIVCERCKTITTHELLYVHEAEHMTLRQYYPDWTFDPGAPYCTIEQYRLWKCRGCDTACLQIGTVVESCDDLDDFDDSRDLVGIRILPEEVGYSSRPKRQIKNYRKLPSQLNSLYREVITCFNNHAYVLCAVGLRSLLEGICKQSEIATGDLVQKIGRLGENHLLPLNIVTSLHRFRFIGNTAAHELESPPTEELALAVDVMEDILNFMYELEYKMSRFGNDTRSMGHSIPASLSEGNS
jgi:hypothetical protein